MLVAHRRQFETGSVLQAVAIGCLNRGQLLHADLDYTGEVSNTGNDNLSNVRVAEAANGTPGTDSFGPFSLAPGQRICYTNGQTVNPSATPPTGCPTLSVTAGLSTGPTGAGHYFPSGANILATLLGRIEFSDTVTATAMDAFGTAVPKAGDPPVTATAHCVICPFGSCPTTP